MRLLQDVRHENNTYQDFLLWDFFLQVGRKLQVFSLGSKETLLTICNGQMYCNE